MQDDRELTCDGDFGLDKPPFRLASLMPHIVALHCCEGKHEPVSDIGTAAADSLKVLDPNRPIREADMVFAEADAVLSI
jgi:hypothetical protein